MKKISEVFLQSACDILADTNDGYSTAQLLKICSSFSVEYDVDIPHTRLPIEAQRKEPPYSIISNVFHRNNSIIY